MKKLVFTIALVLGGLSTYAVSTADISMDTKTASIEAPAQDQESYQEIAVEELPEAVTSAVSKSYPTATINKAYKNEANEYKLEVALKDGTAGTLYADENGNWID